MYGFRTGTLYTHPAHEVGCSGAFRALAHGYNDWEAERLEHLQAHPQYFCVLVTLTPSTEPETHNVYFL